MKIDTEALVARLNKAAAHYGMAKSDPREGGLQAPIDPTAARVLSSIAEAIDYALEGGE